MYKFTVNYYYEKYQTGNINTTTTRTAVVFAKTKKEALEKIQTIDDAYIMIANLVFEEMG